MKVPREWILNMARLEKGCEIGAGKLAIDPHMRGRAMNDPIQMEAATENSNFNPNQTDLERVLHAAERVADELSGPGKFIMDKLVAQLQFELSDAVEDDADVLITTEPPKVKRPLIDRLLGKW